MEVHLAKKGSSYALLDLDTIGISQCTSTNTEVCTSPPMPQRWPYLPQASIASTWLLLAHVLRGCSSAKPLNNMIHVYVFACLILALLLITLCNLADFGGANPKSFERCGMSFGFCLIC